MPGPARPYSREHQADPAAKSAGRQVAKEIRERIAARRHELLDVQFARALDPGHQHGHQAAKDLLDRIMPPETKTDITSDGQRIGYVIQAPAEAEDADAWAKEHAPK